MSTCRNIPEDQAATFSLLHVLAEPNWLGHHGGAAAIDYLLLNGATLEAMKVHRRGVKEHFRHLKVEHGLTVILENDIYRFAPLTDCLLALDV